MSIGRYKQNHATDEWLQLITGFIKLRTISSGKFFPFSFHFVSLHCNIIGWFDFILTFSWSSLHCSRAVV